MYQLIGFEHFQAWIASSFIKLDKMFSIDRACSHLIMLAQRGCSDCPALTTVRLAGAEDHGTSIWD